MYRFFDHSARSFQIPIMRLVDDKNAQGAFYLIIWQIHFLLQMVFMIMDEQADKFGLLCVKTIGDAYLACAGVIEANNNQPGDKISNARAAADFALNVLAVLKLTELPFDIHVRFGEFLVLE